MAVAALAVSGCGPPKDSAGAAGAWVGTITTEDDVTTVVNESGSVWGGEARLVEEASIGVESGDDEYMFGDVYSVYATADRIYVADTQIPAVRAYDYDGAFVGSFGRAGQGPGEYTWPQVVAAEESGRVFVLDNSLRRITVYAPSGELLETWPLETPSCCVGRMFLLDDGAVWKQVDGWRDEPPYYYFGAQAVGPAAAHGEVLWVPDIEYRRAAYQTDGGYEAETPFSPRISASPAPGGKQVLGASDRYRFEVLSREGARLVVERYWEPLPVPPEHKEWERQRTIVFDRTYNDPDQELDGSLIPDTKPAYFALVPAVTGEIWVLREGASERLADCPGEPFDVGYPSAWEQPCWRNRLIVDVFGEDGRYLGEVTFPEALMPYANPLAINGNVVVGVAQDDAGTYRVKRYRLVLPGEE